MSFQPVVPLTGYGGWKFLSRTLASQTSSFNKSPVLQRDTDYFRQKIGGIKTAAALVSDRTLLKVALGAFGLSADLPNRYFMRKVLEGGTADRSSLANKLADKRYLDFSKAFGFGSVGRPLTAQKDFAASIVAKYERQQFEAAIGTQSPDMRLALAAKRELPALAGKSVTADTKWFTIMGNAPLRKVFETAFGLPASFGALGLDRQLASFKDRASQAFGDPGVAQFSSPARIEDLVRLFLARAPGAIAAASPLVRGSAALFLLSGNASSDALVVSLFR